MARTKQVAREKTIDQQFRDAMGLPTPDSSCCDEYDCSCDKHVSKFKHHCDSCGYYGRFDEGDPEFGGDHWICRSCGADINASNVDDTRDDPEDSDSDSGSEDLDGTPIKVVDLTVREFSKDHMDWLKSLPGWTPEKITPGSTLIVEKNESLPPTPKKPAKPSNPAKKRCVKKIDFDAVTISQYSNSELGVDEIEFRGSMLLQPDDDDDCKIIGENWGAAVKRKRDVTLCVESNATIKTLFDTLKHYVIETDESQEIVDRVYSMVNKNG